MAVKAGDRILFGKWSGTEVRIDGEDLLIMKESDILGIILGRQRGRARPPDARTISETSKEHQPDGRQAAEIRHRRA